MWLYGVLVAPLKAGAHCGVHGHRRQGKPKAGCGPCAHVAFDEGRLPGGRAGSDGTAQVHWQASLRPSVRPRTRCK